MKTESLWRVYQANRFVGISRPVLIVTGETAAQNVAFAEHFILTGISKHPLIWEPNYYGVTPASGLTFDDFPEIFSATSLLETEIGFAKAHLENTILEANKDVHRDLYSSAVPLDFFLVEERLLVQMILLGQNKIEIEAMIKQTRNHSLGQYGKMLAQLPKITRSETPPQELKRI